MPGSTFVRRSEQVRGVYGSLTYNVCDKAIEYSDLVLFSLGNQKASLDELEPVKTYCLLAVLEQTEEALETMQRISRILLDPNY
jgi:hypothetical protein